MISLIQLALTQPDCLHRVRAESPSDSTLVSGFNVAKLKFDPTKSFAFGDAREVPTYRIPEAAHYLRIPKATLSSWVVGRNYPTARGQRRFKPLITIADPKHFLL